LDAGNIRRSLDEHRPRWVTRTSNFDFFWLCTSRMQAPRKDLLPSVGAASRLG
jgi:hypothetical protein